SGADGLKQHFVWRCAKGEAECAVAIVRKEPVVGGLQSKTGCGGNTFVASTGNLKEDFLLALKHDLAVVKTARGVHDAVNIDELLAGKAFVSFACFVRLSNSAGF